VWGRLLSFIAAEDLGEHRVKISCFICRVSIAIGNAFPNALPTAAVGSAGEASCRRRKDYPAGEDTNAVSTYIYAVGYLREDKGNPRQRPEDNAMTESYRAHNPSC
jgi:hypothetical protein